ncbi:hypothetical protein P2G74_16940 [Cronobacter muytjensii]|uniref:hypothetical protein n=1 Tax=Cronobacter muytjensii TaxID=413501 RepID=UPI0009491D44|nr:hypothetical protein [Cronobacter muytjensii]ELY6275858.1 hypothetical protein [Cronobacter muytjensii]MBF4811910.1 hypothetical protein [Cronobacter muytjensii]MEB8641642.1 hypothetical protein [Cronobacter muytjensii]
MELLQFCEQEGHRQGLNDALCDRVGQREHSPFHPAFMGGYPEQAWHDACWTGVQQNEDTTPEAINAEIQETLANPDTSFGLRDALTSVLERDRADAVSDADFLNDIMMCQFTRTHSTITDMDGILARENYRHCTFHSCCQLVI